MYERWLVDRSFATIGNSSAPQISLAKAFSYDTERIGLPFPEGFWKEWKEYTKTYVTRRIIIMSNSGYLTVRRYAGVTDSKEAARRVEEGFIPLISKIPGFISYYWVDEGDGVMVSVSVFASREAEEESNRLAADFVKQHIAPLLPKPPQITAGQVVARAAKK